MRDPGADHNGAIEGGGSAKEDWAIVELGTGRRDLLIPNRRTAMGFENHVRTIGGDQKSGPNIDDDRWAPQPRGIQFFTCGLLGHVRSNSPKYRGQGKNLNGIGRTKTTPPSGPK